MPLLLVALCTQANHDIQNVRIVTEHLAPYQISKNNELVSGSIGLQVKAILANVLPHNTIEVLPWTRAFQLASTRPNTIIFSLVRTPEREKNFIWIKQIGEVTTEMISLKDSDIAVASKLPDLKGLAIGVKRQDAISNFLVDRGFEYEKDLIEILSTLSTIQMLEKGRVEVIPASSEIIDFYCQKTGCNRSDFKTIYTVTELSAKFYLAVSLGSDESLIQLLRKGFEDYDFTQYEM